MRSEYPSGLVIGPGIWRSPVRFPAPRRSFRGHFFVNFGMSWDLSRSGLGDVSGWVWDGFGKMSGWPKHMKFSKMAGSIFPESGYTKITFLAYPRQKISNF